MADVGCFGVEMRARSSPRDLGIAALAARQHGIVAHRQLLELGLGHQAIRYRAAIGRLHVIHGEVYAVGHPAVSPRGRLMAAVLACGPGALLSHQSAAWLWELAPPPGSDIDVTAPRALRGRPGIVVHRVRRLDPRNSALRDGIPATTVSRTLLDLAEVCHQSALRRACERAERLRLFDLRELEELCRRSRGRRGLRPLRELLASLTEAAPPTRSELERTFLGHCRAAGLPAPAVNVRVAGLEVDCLWLGQRLVVELDGYAFHGDRAAFERDRIRDATLQLAGFRVLRVTYRRLGCEPEAVMGSVRALLAGR